MSLPRAAAILDALARLGVVEVCICPGARNAPLALALEDAPPLGMRALPFFEERVAGFFALGRARASARPVAVCTTSGTAVAELLPAVVEAYYSGVPLVLVTADRPHRFRGSGAPQAIEQADIFGCYAASGIDLDADADPAAIDGAVASWRGDGPLHLNVAFAEPLLHGALTMSGAPDPVTVQPPRPQVGAAQLTAARAELVQWIHRSERPLVVLGELPESWRPAVEAWLRRWGALVVAEGPSGLRESEALAGQALRGGDGVLAPDGLLFGVGHRGERRIDGVLRIGSVPTTRLWRDLAERLADVPTLSITDPSRPFAGLPGGQVLAVDGPALLAELEPPPLDDEALAAFVAHDHARSAALVAAIAAEPQSELALVRALSATIASDEPVYVGNSLPVREWDLAATHAVPHAPGASRGANGIDGQLATFLGWADPQRRSWALVGDLTALYDLSAPWALRHLDADRARVGLAGAADVRIVVLHNGGGRIFERMFGRPSLEHRHDLGLRGFADLWDLAYVRATAVASDWPARALIELRPDEAATRRVWAALDALDGRASG